MEGVTGRSNGGDVTPLGGGVSGLRRVRAREYWYADEMGE